MTRTFGRRESTNTFTGASAAATETTDRTASTARTNSNVGGGKYYQEYLRNEGRSLGESGARGDSVARDRNQNGSQYEGSQRGMDGTSEPRDGIQRAREEKMLQQQQQQQQGGIQTRQSSATYQRQQPVGYRQGSQQGQPRMRRGSDQAQDLPVRGTGFGSKLNHHLLPFTLLQHSSSKTRSSVVVS